MRSTLRITLAALALVVAGVGAGTLFGITITEAEDRSDLLSTQVDDLTTQNGVLAEDLRRTRAERNRLEALLAAEDPPVVCPRRFLSTAGSEAYPAFAYDFPCSWHLLRDGLNRVAHPEFQGVTGELSLVSQIPVVLTPTAGALADIELTDWSGDGGADDPLPDLATWAEHERGGFLEPPDEDRFEGAEGRTIMRFRGTVEIAERRAAATLLLWTYTDPLTSVRHIVRAIAHEPSRPAREALDRLARSFRVLPN